jgi:hypothetical protein
MNEFGPFEMLEPGLKVFSISGHEWKGVREWQGFIVCSGVDIHEDDGEYNQPSKWGDF